MGLFGALFAGVSGVDSQSNKIGIISNNISNVNTVGYKQGQAEFDTLVVPSGGTSFSPGGVIGQTQQLVNQQGTIAATSSPTDVAISGNGFFVVNTKADGTGQTLYTRNGSFTQDSQGNFVNSDGYYLQALPIDAATGAPEQANAQNLKTVSINQSASGAAVATTAMTLAANLDSAQTVLQGPGVVGIKINPDDSSINGSNTANQIILPDSVNNLVAGDSFTATNTDSTSGVTTNTFTYGGFVVGTGIANGTNTILSANSDSADFLGGVTTGVAPNALSFSITANGATSTFTYNSIPNTTEGQFNSLDTLVASINNTTGLTASVSNGSLVVSATNPNSTSVTFQDGQSGTTVAGTGIDWVGALGLSTIPQESGFYFNTLSGLAAVINGTSAANTLTAKVTNPTSDSPTLTITSANPLDTLSFSDLSANTGGSLLQELGFYSSAGSGSQLTSAGNDTGGGTLPNSTTALAAQPIYETGTFGATYNSLTSTTDMSSGAVTPQYSKDITVYDAQGNSHTLALNFVKLETNTWAVEVTAVPASDVHSATGDGQVASGILTFNGSGELIGATGTIANPSGFQAQWTNGAAESSIAADLGLDTSTGIIQTAGAFGFSTANQNGSPVGELTGVNVDSSGNVVASFSNGQTETVYQIPLASVANPDGMESVSGDAYIQTVASGIANLQFAGTSGVGTFTPSALEQSNVDLSTQLTDLIVAQQAYGANSKLLTVADSLLQELDQIIQ
jgi:flagellar hook protein FlgE